MEININVTSNIQLVRHIPGENDTHSVTSEIPPGNIFQKYNWRVEMRADDARIKTITSRVHVYI